MNAKHLAVVVMLSAAIAIPLIARLPISQPET